MHRIAPGERGKGGGDGKLREKRGCEDGNGYPCLSLLLLLSGCTHDRYRGGRKKEENERYTIFTDGTQRYFPNKEEKSVLNSRSKIFFILSFSMRL